MRIEIQNALAAMHERAGQFGQVFFGELERLVDAAFGAGAFKEFDVKFVGVAQTEGPISLPHIALFDLTPKFSEKVQELANSIRTAVKSGCAASDLRMPFLFAHIY